MEWKGYGNEQLALLGPRPVFQWGSSCKIDEGMDRDSSEITRYLAKERHSTNGSYYFYYEMCLLAFLPKTALIDS